MIEANASSKNRARCVEMVRSNYEAKCDVLLTSCKQTEGKENKEGVLLVVVLRRSRFHVALAFCKTSLIELMRMRVHCKGGGKCDGWQNVARTTNVEGCVVVLFARAMIDAIGLKSRRRGKVSNPLRKCDVQVVFYDVF